MKEKFSKHYDDDDYFNWQSSIGAFGGWANKTKFLKYISEGHTVLDFGCGGGFLLKQLNCKNRIGVEVNPSAAEQARQIGGRKLFELACRIYGGIDISWFQVRAIGRVIE
jgi:SAM-dependent methyltransferase